MQTHKMGFAKIVFFGGLATALILGIIANTYLALNRAFGLDGNRPELWT